MKKAVEDVQNLFRSQRITGNYTPRENLHITLAFVGEYNDPEAVLEAMEQVPFSPFTIRMDKIGCFDELWWTGLTASKELEKLVINLRRALVDAAIPYDNKKFKAHVTFLRKPRYFGGNLTDMAISPAEMQVDSISLMRSTRGKNGMIYTELGSVSAR